MTTSLASVTLKDRAAIILLLNGTMLLKSFLTHHDRYASADFNRELHQKELN
jgi:hypothetical protein